MKKPSLSVDFGLVGVLNRRPSQVYTQLCGWVAAASSSPFFLLTSKSREKN